MSGVGSRHVHKIGTMALLGKHCVEGVFDFDVMYLTPGSFGAVLRFHGSASFILLEFSPKSARLKLKDGSNI